MTNKTIIWDTETTNLLLADNAPLSDQPKIIEFGAIICDDDYQILDEVSFLIYPEQSISDEITKITGLTDADLKGAETFIEALPKFESAFLGCSRMIAHNLPFDSKMLINELKRYGREFAFPYPPNQICSAQMSEEVFGKRLKLLTLYEEVFGEKLKQTHRALDDARALYAIVREARW